VNPAPAGFGRGIAYDSPQAYDRIAATALAFAEDEKSGIADQAEYGDAGFVVQRSKPSPSHLARRRSRSPVHHASKKTPAQLEHEIAEALERAAAYEKAKAKGGLLDAEVNAATTVLRMFPRTGAMGLVSDAVRDSPEYRAANARFKTAFEALRKFNSVFTKTFAKEIRAERSRRYGS
jgi:hypothetical protein